MRRITIFGGILAVFGMIFFSSPIVHAIATTNVNQKILPLDCVFNEVNDGLGTLVFLTPEACGVIDPQILPEAANAILGSTSATNNATLSTAPGGAGGQIRLPLDAAQAPEISPATSDSPLSLQQDSLQEIRSSTSWWWIALIGALVLLGLLLVGKQLKHLLWPPSKLLAGGAAPTYCAALLPDTAAIQKFASFSNNDPPFLPLYTARFLPQDLKRAKSRLEVIAQQTLVLPLQAVQLRDDQQMTHIDYAATPTLNQLQEDVVTALRPLQHVSQAQQIEAQFVPKIALGQAPKTTPAAANFSASFDTLAFCKLDAQGRCSKIIATFRLVVP